jgi:hypothetical protein
MMNFAKLLMTAGQMQCHAVINSHGAVASLYSNANPVLCQLDIPGDYYQRTFEDIPLALL